MGFPMSCESWSSTKPSLFSQLTSIFLDFTPFFPSFSSQQELKHGISGEILDMAHTLSWITDSAMALAQKQVKRTKNCASFPGSFCVVFFFPCFKRNLRAICLKATAVTWSDVWLTI